MDSRKRTWIKAIGWQLMGLLSMTVVGFLFTGSLWDGGAIAGVNALVGLMFYILYERVWTRVSWGRIHHSSRPFK